MPADVPRAPGAPLLQQGSGPGRVRHRHGRLWITGGRFVAEAIESALAQEHPDTEVVVVDDGSTDDSLTLITAFEPRVRVVVKPNGGQGSALNAGYAAATGGLVLFLDADDVLYPGAVAAGIEAARDDVSHVHWPMVDVDAEGPPDRGADAPLRACHRRPPRAAHRRWAPAVVRRPGMLGRGMAPELPGADHADAGGRLPHRRGRLSRGLGSALRAPPGAREAPERLSPARENHSSGGYDAMLCFDVEIWTSLGRIAAEHATRLGIEVDPERWRRQGWAFRLAAAVGELDAVVGRDAPFVLIDGCELALERSSGRLVIPFLERDGEYWGLPEDDAHAIAELDRLRAEGARFVVLAWPAFWWVQTYPGFVRHLRRASTACSTTTGS